MGAALLCSCLLLQTCVGPHLVRGTCSPQGLPRVRTPHPDFVSLISVEVTAFLAHRVCWVTSFTWLLSLEQWDGRSVHP